MRRKKLSDRMYDIFHLHQIINQADIILEIETWKFNDADTEDESYIIL